MTDKIILTDIDGVVLDWETQFHQWMNMRGHNIVKNGVYYMDEAYDLSTIRAEQYLADFNTSAYIIGLSTFRDAVSGIASLKDAGYRFIAITSIGDDYYTSKLRTINLEDHFGKDAFIEIHCIGENKEPLLKKYKDISNFWIEDSPKNAELGVELGYTTFLFNHLHNQYYINDKVIRIDKWKEISETILNATW